MRENIIILNNVKGQLDFVVYYENGDMDSVSLKVTCAEDIEYKMKLFFEKRWEELFENLFSSDEIVDAVFEGIELSHVDDNNNISRMMIFGNTCKGSIMIDYEALADKNAEKIKKIRDIINE
jgi:hypothetical protein